MEKPWMGTISSIENDKKLGKKKKKNESKEQELWEN